MSNANVVRAREVRELVISFIDLSTFARDATGRDERAIADMLDSYYERVGDAVEGAGGTVVKFIGDGALLIFPVARADAAIVALLDLRNELDRWLAEGGWTSRLIVKIHTGPVVAGEYGTRREKRFDILGNAVNVTARLPRPFHLTPQAFRLLAPESRARLKKHTPPITYIPVEDPHG